MTKERDTVLPYGRQAIDQDDVRSVVEALHGDWLTTGPTVAAFESAVADRAGARHGIAVSSGTSALLCACQAAGLGEGDDAVVPTLTFAATASAVRLCGAEVRFADIDPESWCLSAESVGPALSDQTKVVIGVDFAGQPCDWHGIATQLANRTVTTLADGAHALGGRLGDFVVGSLADMTCFSFHPVKAVTTAEGGMVVTDSEHRALDLRRIRNHGIVRDPEYFSGHEAAEFSGPESNGPDPWYYEVQEPGLNHRISDVQCALGLSQLDKLDQFLQRRRTIADLYTAAFADSELLSVPQVRAGCESAWHIYVIRLNLPALKKTRREIFDALRERKLGVQVHYMPLHLHPYYAERYGHRRGDFPHAEAYYDGAITIPLHPGMTDEDAGYVIDTVLGVLEAAKR